MSSNFSSVSTLSLCFLFMSIKSCSSKFIQQIVNCLSAGNSFMLKFSLTLYTRSVFHVGVIRKYTLL
jgi:hypothetical protein